MGPPPEGASSLDASSPAVWTAPSRCVTASRGLRCAPGLPRLRDQSPALRRHRLGPRRHGSIAQRGSADPLLAAVRDEATAHLILRHQAHGILHLLGGASVHHLGRHHRAALRGLGIVARSHRPPCARVSRQHADQTLALTDRERIASECETLPRDGATQDRQDSPM